MTTNPASPAPPAAPATPTARRSAAAVLLAAALLLAGCGGGGGDDGDGVASVSGDEAAASDESEQEAAEEELYDWVACMNDEGVEIPDPTRDADGNLVIQGDGFTLGGGDAGATVRVGGEDDGDDGESAISPDDMDAATEVCGMPPRLGPSDMSEEDVQARQDDALAFAECMRDEGVEDFPDPDFSADGPGGEPRRSDSGDGPSSRDDDGPRIALGPFGEIDMGDPTTEAAFEACQDIIGAPGGPGGPGGAGGGPDSEDADT